jgi:hypothetical protein
MANWRMETVLRLGVAFTVETGPEQKNPPAPGWNNDLVQLLQHFNKAPSDTKTRD